MFIYNVTGRNGVTVTNKQYQDINSSILQSATISGSTITLHIRSNYPQIDIDGTIHTLPQVSPGIFDGTIDLVASGDVQATNITGDDELGITDTVQLLIAEPPVVQTAAFTGAYPGAQTELKEGDTFQIAGTLDKAADLIKVVNFGACVESFEVIIQDTSFLITATIADRGDTPQALTAKIQARDAVTGAYGPEFETTNTVVLNNLHPAVSIATIDYPPTQGALKGSESATVNHLASDFDSIQYTSAELTITNPSAYESAKSVQRANGSYNDSIPNFIVTATRAANGAVTVQSSIVIIADVAPTITLSGNAGRLRTGPASGEPHLLTITCDQSLQALQADGNFQEVSWQGGPKVYTRTLLVPDGTVPGHYNLTNILATGLSGLTANVLANNDYEVGGFVARDVTFDPFQQSSTITPIVSDYSKLQAGIFTPTNQQSIKNPAQGNTDDLYNTYTITSPTTIFWNDQARAATNSTGTAKLLALEEIA